MNAQYSAIALRAYQILYRLVFASAVLLGIILVASGDVSPGPFFILILPPVLAPFIVNGIYLVEKPLFFFIYITTLLIFTLLYAILTPNFGILLICVWLVEITSAWIISYTDLPPENTKQSIVQKDQPTHISPENTIQRHIAKADMEINRYAEKVKPLHNILEKSQKYLIDVNERLNYPHLSESNKQTSLQLREMLNTSNENYRLMIRFFEEARMRYEREKRNLKEKQGNLEIIAFLNETDRSKEIATIEKAALDIEFQKQLLKIENELPVIKAEMNAKAQLLSHDLKAELTETIERLKEG